MWSAVVESLGGAACFAVSSVLQHDAARVTPESHAVRPRLVLDLVHHPGWLIGNAGDVAGFGLQFLALRSGSLALVQPIFVSGLVFAMAGNAWVERRWPTRREWAGSLAVAAGLAAFLAAARPTRGDPHGTLLGWVVVAAAAGAAVGVCVVFGRGSERRKGVLLATATGICTGVLAPLSERTGLELRHGFTTMVVSWPPYALAAVALVGFLLNQSAFQARELKWSLPVLTALEPLVSIAIGQVLFHERISSGPGALVAEALSGSVMLLGVLIVAERSTSRMADAEAARRETTGAR